MEDPNPQCQIEGNPDLYGIGVRVGLYSQWIALLLVTLFDPTREDTYRITNLIIQLALFLGLCVESSQDANLVGSIVTQLLLCGSLSSLTGDGISHFAHLSGILRVLFYTALSAYGCWFWFTGIDGTLEPGCQHIVFLGSSTIDGWLRTFGKVVSVLGLVASAGSTIFSAYSIARRFRQGIRAAFVGPPKQRPQLELSLLLLSAGMIVFSIYVVEYLLDVNGVTGLADVESVGQFIPLLVGGLSCVLTSGKIISTGSIWRKRCVFLFGLHL